MAAIFNKTCAQSDSCKPESCKPAVVECKETVVVTNNPWDHCIQLTAKVATAIVVIAGVIKLKEYIHPHICPETACIDQIDCKRKHRTGIRCKPHPEDCDWSLDTCDLTSESSDHEPKKKVCKPKPKKIYCQSLPAEHECCLAQLKCKHAAKPVCKVPKKKQPQHCKKPEDDEECSCE